ncbi:MAG: M23 family metallopeptidase [Clostridia bacterium]|nr:M23 family metallopeptidase [Clostridia bacterium]
MRVKIICRRGLAIFLSLVLVVAMVAPVQANTEDADDWEAVVAPYRVQSGDTLWNIAEEFNLDLELMALMNGLLPESVIIPGQTLSVPAEEAIIHQVQEGESLWSIAREYDISVDTIIGENDLMDVNLIRVGQELAIPVPIDREAFAGKKNIVSRGSMVSMVLWPTQGILSSPYGMRWGRPHEGIDIAAPKGEAIVASMGGKVVYAGNRGSYGKTVILEHRGKTETLYAHASELLVAEGERVTRGQPIALVGSTGRSTGPHLHFEILRQGVPENPLKHMPRAGN